MKIIYSILTILLLTNCVNRHLQNEKVELKIPDIFNPRFSYSLSKIAGESLVINFFRDSKTKYLIFRPHNIFGPQMGFKHVIPQLTKKILLNSKNKIIIQNSKHKRTFCDINFAIDLILKISHKKDSINKTFNIGSPNREISVIDLAQKIKKILNSKKKLIPSNIQKFNSPEKRKPDMKRSLRYSKIKHNFEKGLKETVMWYKGYYTK